jgi:hypothetical protein
MLTSVVRFQVLTATGMKRTLVRVVATCNLIEVERRFGVTGCFHYRQCDGRAVSRHAAFLPVIFAVC